MLRNPCLRSAISHNQILNVGKMLRIGTDARTHLKPEGQRAIECGDSGVAVFGALVMNEALESERFLENGPGIVNVRLFAVLGIVSEECSSRDGGNSGWVDRRFH